MHNQDTAKDDFMEAIMEIMNKLAEFYKKSKSAEKNIEELESDVELNSADEENEMSYDEHVLRFRKSMKEIIQETENEQVKVIAQTFHDNPLESMKMLSAIVSEQTVEKAQFLSDNALKTEQFLDGVKSAINMDDPRAMDLIATMDALKNEAKNNKEVADSLLKDVRPLYQDAAISDEIANDNTNDINAGESTVSIQEAEDLLHSHFNSLSENEKSDYEQPTIHLNENTNDSMILHFESKKGIEPKTKSLILNLENGTGKEVNVSSNRHEMSEETIGNSFKSTKDFTVQELRQNRDKQRDNEQDKPEEKEVKKEKTKSREMDGPER